MVGLKVVAFGRGELLHDSIVSVQNAGHQVRLIITNEPHPEHAVGAQDFESLAKRIGAELLISTRLAGRRSRAAISRAAPDVAISANWPRILGRALHQFPGGALIAHAGDLPRYRGNAPVNWAMLDAESHIGVCIHFMNPDGADNGAVVERQRLEIGPDDYVGDLWAAITGVVPDMFVAALEKIGRGIRPEDCHQQDEDRALRCFPRSPAHGLIDWELDAEAVVRLVRATGKPYPGAFTLYRGLPLTVWRASIGEYPGAFRAVPGQVLSINSDGTVDVNAGDSVLRLEEVSYEGSDIPPARVIRSIRHPLGMPPRD